MADHDLPKRESNRRRTHTPLQIVSGAVVSIAFAASLALTFTALAATVYNVSIAGDPTVAQVHTFKTDPVRVVCSAGITLSDEDLISVTSVNGGDNSDMVVYKSGEVSVDVDGEEVAVETSGTVAKTIADSGIELNPGDVIDAELNSLTYDGMEISIDRAYDIYVKDGDKTYTYRTTGCKAGEAVHALGLTLAEEDTLDVAKDKELSEGDTVQILRCRYDTRTVEKKIDYDTTIVKDDTLYEGQSEIRTEGVYGKKEIVYRDKYLGTNCVASVTVSETVTREPVNAVKAVGTRVYSAAGKVPYSKLALPEGVKLDENGVPTAYQSYMDGHATAYYGGGLTSTGVPAAVGYVAVNPKVIPYGTKLWITTLDGSYVYGCAIAADTGGFAKQGRVDVDLYMDTYDDCCQFGFRSVRIYIL